MKLSKSTLDILKNFSRINPSIMLKKGSFIMTKSINNVVYGEATIDDVIDDDIGIYDINMFLNMANLVGTEAEISFEGETGKILIKNGHTKSSLPAADVSTIKVPKKRLELPVADLIFEITGAQLEQLIKASAMMKLNVISIENIDGKLIISAKNKDDSKSNFSLEVGDYDGAHIFNFDISVDNMSFINNDYKVMVSSAGAVKFESPAISYVVILESTTKHDFPKKA